VFILSAAEVMCL